MWTRVFKSRQAYQSQSRRRMMEAEMELYYLRMAEPAITGFEDRGKVSAKENGRL